MNAHSTIWPGHWITPPTIEQLPQFHAYRLDFVCSQEGQASLLVTADQRYILWLDGLELGRGPERGDLRHWFCDTYNVHLKCGNHLLVALVWSVSLEIGTAPRAQVSDSPGFYLKADAPFLNLLTTGIAPWKSARVPGVRPLTGLLHGAANIAGCLFGFDGAAWPQGLARGVGLDWSDASLGATARDVPSNSVWGVADGRMLTHSSLPPQIRQPLSAGKVRYLDAPASQNTETVRVTTNHSMVDEIPIWQNWIESRTPLKLPPRTTRRAIIDLGDYACAYSITKLKGGTGGTLRVGWAESLYEKFAFDGFKGNRSEIEGKVFAGRFDQLNLTGSGNQILEPLWWNAGRYVEIFIETGETELVLESFTLRETRYPLERQDTHDVPLPYWENLHHIMWRTLQMCAHETYMDCPYYEQLQYAGDSRLQMLVTYVSSHDARLPAKALKLFGSSLGSDGLTAAAYPAFGKQVIPQFSLFWVAMLHDHLFWRGDIALIRSLLPNSRRVMETFLELVQDDGSLVWPAGWDWIDWSSAWREDVTTADSGRPKPDESGLSGINALQFVYISGLAAEVEEHVGHPLFAQRYRQARLQVMEAVRRLFWNQNRGIFADTPAMTSFSEHAQCYAVLSGLLSEPEKQQIARSLGRDTSLAPATVYFRHYLFEAFRALGCTERILEGLGLWRTLAREGCFTTIEQPEPSRSDCHAWGAHPIYHLYASLLGLRPVRPGFQKVEFRPQLGGLPYLSARLPHPQGWIEAKVVCNDSQIQGSISLPGDVVGTYHGPEGTVALVSGLNEL